MAEIMAPRSRARLYPLTGRAIDVPVAELIGPPLLIRTRFRTYVQVCADGGQQWREEAEGQRGY